MTVRSTYKWLRQQNEPAAQELATIADAIISQLNDTDGLVYGHALAPRDFFSEMLDRFLAEVIPVLYKSVAGGLHGLSAYLGLTPEQMIAELRAALEPVDCPDCGNTRACQHCSGTGHDPNGNPEDLCLACRGSAICPYCQPKNSLTSLSNPKGD